MNNDKKQVDPEGLKKLGYQYKDYARVDAITTKEGIITALAIADGYASNKAIFDK